jgi:two-component system, NarL family, nitrate/nitrite response regulator NarL
MRPLRVLVVDDHAAVRRSMGVLLELRPEWVVCGEASDGLEAIQKTRELAPDLILLDISMPRMDGASAGKIIHREAPHTGIILVSQNDGVVMDHVAEQIGAVESVAKVTLARDLPPAIERAMARHEGHEQAS